MRKERLWLDEEIHEFISTSNAAGCFTPHALGPVKQGQTLGRYLRQISGQGAGHGFLSRPALDSFIIQALRCSIGHMARQSFFYKHKLADFRHVLQAIETGHHDLPALLQLMDALPFTTSQELAHHSEEFLSIGHSQVAGLISIPTSGTSGKRKRIFCSQTDLERTIRFFQYGMRFLLPKIQGQNVLLLMSGDREGSVGHLLQAGLARWSIACHVYGFPMDMAHCLQYINAARPSCIVGLPSHLMTLCRMGLSPQAVKSLKVVLLSGEWASPTIKNVLQEELKCPVFLHYGLTESGLAGAVECSELAGCHIREADMMVNIVDEEGRLLADGEWGEVILTTLTRQATPLLRYKTGDWGRIVPGPCPCGSALKRLEAGERMIHRLTLPSGCEIGFGELDAALFSLPWLAGYSLTEQKLEEGFHGKTDSQVGEGQRNTPFRMPTAEAVEQGLAGEKITPSLPRGLRLHLDCTEAFTPSHEAQVVEALRSIRGFEARMGTTTDSLLRGFGPEGAHGGLSIVLMARILEQGKEKQGKEEQSKIGSCMSFSGGPDKSLDMRANSDGGGLKKNADAQSDKIRVDGYQNAGNQNLGKQDDSGQNTHARKIGEQRDENVNLHAQNGLDRALSKAQTSAENQVLSGKRRMPFLPF